MPIPPIQDLAPVKRWFLEFQIYCDMKPVTRDWRKELLLDATQEYLDLTILEQPAYFYRIVLWDMKAAEPDWGYAVAGLRDPFGRPLGNDLPIKLYLPEHSVPTLIHFPPTDKWIYDNRQNCHVAQGIETYSLAIRGCNKPLLDIETREALPAA